MQAAVRVFGQSPGLGVGPDGFRDAYAFSKNPLNPEEISSPHSMLLDWGAGLGVIGLIAGAWVVWMLARATSGAVVSAGETAETDDGGGDEELSATLGKAAGLMAAAVVLAGAFIEREGTSGPAAVARLVGLLIWVGLAWGLVRVMRRGASGGMRAVGLAMAAGGVALMAHGQIEVTPGWTQSAGLFVVFVALAASVWGARESDGGRAGGRSGGRSGAFVGVVVAAGRAIASAALGVGVSRAWEQERELLNASAMCRGVGEARMLLGAGMSERDARRRDEIFAELVEVVGKPDGSVGFDRLIAAAESRVLGPTAQRLERAAGMIESWAIRREASRVLLRWAMDGATADGERGELIARALRVVALAGDEAQAIERAPATRWGGVAQRLGWSATVAQAAAEMPGQDRRAWLLKAERWLALACGFERHSPDLAMELLRVREGVLRATDAGDATHAEARRRVREAAGEVLRRDDLQRLDPMRRLAGAERSRVEALAAER
jgi:hypothetical protein